MPRTRRLDRMFLRAGAALAFAIVPPALSFCHPSSPPAASAQETPPARSENGELECVSYCSATRPGTSLMEVRWRLADAAMGETELRASARQQGLEATVYSDGFSRGLYVVAPAVRAKAPFRRPGAREGAPAAAQPRPPVGLDKLIVADVATRLDAAAPTFRLMRNAPAAAGEWLAVRLEGVSPGLDYTYRRTGGSSVVTCPAVVCPVDRIRAPSKKQPAPGRR